MPGQERRQGGRVPGAGADQGGGVVCCAMYQAGGRRDPVQSVQQIGNQRGGSGRRAGTRCAADQAGRRAWIRRKKKQAGRAVCGVVLPAVLCAAVIFPPWHRSTERRRGTFHRAAWRYFSPLPEGSDS